MTALMGAVQAGDATGEGGLAAAALPDHRQALAFPDRARDTIDRKGGTPVACAVPSTEALDHEERFGPGRPQLFATNESGASVGVSSWR